MSKATQPDHAPDHAKAWGDFWARNQAGSDAGGCLPQRWSGIEERQKAAWAGFAKQLPKGARLLDLATGDGRVMRWLLAGRRDLKLTGCDLASQLPAPPKGTKVRAGVRMEDLPFGDGQFSAVVSQFGFEYGDTEQSAAEVARVTQRDGWVGLMTHRMDGPILAHNRERRAAIAWAIEEQRLIEKGKGSLQMRGLGGSVVPPLLAQAPAAGAAKFGAQSAAWEIAEAVCQTLVMGAGDHPGRVAATLEEIGKQAANEIGRIASLEAACASAASLDFEPTLKTHGLELQSCEPVFEPDSDRAFADMRIYRRS